MFGKIISSRENDLGFFGLRQATFDPMLNLKEFNPSHITIKEMPLEDGQLVRVFNSIASAEELLTTTIDFQRDHRYQEWQKDIAPALWHNMFALALPARLQKTDGSIIDGKLEAFSEQGMEGRIEWMLFDFTNNSYNSLHNLKKGDLLTIFSHVTEGNIAWEGRLRISDQPYDTGGDITLVGRDPDARDSQSSLQGLNFRTIRDIYANTYLDPDFKTLDHWAVHNMPAQIIS